MANLASAWEKPARPLPQRIGPIANVIHCREHMVRIFKEARTGKLDISDASRLVNILAQVQRSFEASDMEERLKRLEEGADE
ncbi:hypothetical protein [Pseudogemmobacter sonorensis]|uniref:hypothetical protein n=1 Tax=Pseudogemmobacter sonorensis TaxID=2989681 RepID=UPI00367A203D